MSAAELERRAGFVMTLRAMGYRDTRVLAALETTPRPHFVASEHVELAYAERHLPLACGQMMERPSQVAHVMEALSIEPHHRVLEIGTGSGWTTAILGQLARSVVSLERYRTLANRASAVLAKLPLGDVNVRLADGLRGVGDGPFDRIVAWGAVEAFPRVWLDALADGGVMIAPVGRSAAVMLTRHVHGRPIGIETDLGPNRATPLEPGLARAS